MTVRHLRVSLRTSKVAHLRLTFTTTSRDGSNGTTNITTSPTVTVTAPAPTVTGVSPTSGSTNGGTSVTVTGTNLSGATAVTKPWA